MWWLLLCWLGLGCRGEARNRVAEIAENAKPLAEHGINRFRDNNCNVYAEKEGNSSGYLTARIASDNPEVLEGMKQGKYRTGREC